MSHRPRKRFGQNFLHDNAVITKILNALQVDENDNIVEIGPGLGALTQPLLKGLKKLTAIEIDRDLQRYLTDLPIAKDKLQLIAADALTVDYSQLGADLKIIGNLPYNISTPLILHLLNYVSSIQDMYFMLQKDVVSRLAAEPGTKAYGRLTIMVQYYCEVEFLFDVPPEAFHPKPKVDSAVVKLTPYSVSPYSVIDVKVLEKVVAQAFGMRRKTLANNLKPLISAAKLNDLEINPLARPEQITIKEYIHLAKYLEKLV